jgi:hypothetical protein
MLLSIPNISHISLVIGKHGVGSLYICIPSAAVNYKKGLLTFASPKTPVKENMAIPMLPTTMPLYTGFYTFKKKMIIKN